MPISATQLRSQWKLMPDRASVTYSDQTALGVYTTSTVTNCWWRPLGIGEGAPSLGVYVKGNRNWFIPKASKASQPNVGDLILGGTTTIDPSPVTWTVVDVSDAGALGSWQCRCISLQLQADLRQTCTISRPSNAQDSTGRQALTSYSTVASNVACRLQPEDGPAGETMERVTIDRKLTLFLGTRVAVQAKDRVTVSAVNYTVLSSEMPDRLDELQRVIVEQIG